jgi:hypothetical protein
MERAGHSSGYIVHFTKYVRNSFKESHEFADFFIDYVEYYVVISQQ